MYSPERMKWWVDRSREPEHQKAYDRVASQIMPTGDSVIVDFCCGNGELLKRIYTKYMEKAKRRNYQNPPLLIGADISQNMLELARKNLQEAGAKPIVIKDGAEATRHKGVVLVEDDITDSRIPAEISDVSFLTFPQLKIKMHENPLVAGFVEENPNMDVIGLRFLIEMYSLSRITKKGRHSIIADYDTFDGKDSVHDQDGLRQQAELGMRFNLRFIRAQFFRSLEVMADVEEEVLRNRRLPGRELGYRIYMFKKNN